MESIKKYAWLLVLAVLGIVAYFYFREEDNEMQEEQPVNNLPDGAQVLGAGDYEDRISAVLKDMEGNKEWLNLMKEQTQDAWHSCGGKTLDECKRINAEFVLQQSNIFSA